MQPDPAELRRHYASLSDEALLEIDRDDLTEMARSCYDTEMFHRNIATESGAIEGSESRDDEEPDWLPDAACACSFDAVPGTNTAPDLDEARNILESAGVPCYAATREADRQGAAGARFDSYDLMVPGSLNLKAVSILDKEFFNPRLEAEWRSHFEALTDDELHALNLDDLTAGLLDRVDRLTAAYHDELDRRED